jgi:hypothetical protein
LPVDSSFTHAIAHTPVGPVESCRSFFIRSTSGGLPCRSCRSAPPLTVSRIARRSLTLWPACLLTPQGSLFQECVSPIRYLLEPLRVLPVGATSDRAGFAPAGINTPFTAHRPKKFSVYNPRGNASLMPALECDGRASHNDATDETSELIQETPCSEKCWTGCQTVFHALPRFAGGWPVVGDGSRWDL